MRLYAGDGKLLGSRLVPTCDGHGSQGAVPVHFGLPDMAAVMVEVTFPGCKGHRRKPVDKVLPGDWTGRALVLRGP